MNNKSLAAIALLLVIVGPICLGYMTALDKEEVQGWESVESKNISELLINHNTPYTATYRGTTNNSTLYANYNGGAMTPEYVSVGHEYSVYPVTNTTNVTLSPVNGQVTMPLDYSWSYSAAEISYTLNGTGYALTWSSSGYTVSYNAETRTFNGIHVDTLTISSATDITILRQDSTDLYGQPQDGWRLPLAGQYWGNRQTNESVTFLLTLPAGASITLGYWVKAIITNTDGIVTVTAQSDSDYGEAVTLGAYQYMQVVIEKLHITVNAVDSWPSMNSAPRIYNTVEVEPLGPIRPLPNLNSLYLGSSSAVRPILRCDSTEIAAGTFPSTLDYTLNIGDLFPGRVLNMRLNSIGVYGDTLTVSDTEYSVNNGRITLDGKPVPLKGSLWSFFPENGNITVAVNGHQIGTYTEIPPITFGGEWSMTATAYFMEPKTNTQTVWHAGEFGLDKTGLAAAGLIIAGITFIALGMYGRNSGTKVGLLLLICGGAAAAYIMII